MASGSGWNLWVWLAGGGCGSNLWVWLLGVVVRRYIDFLILLIPIYFSCICSFFILAPLLFCNLCDNFSAQYKHKHGRLQAFHGSRMKGWLHIMFYTRRSAHKRTLHILLWTLAVCLQGAGCRSLSSGRALYRDASWAAYMLDLPP